MVSETMSCPPGWQDTWVCHNALSRVNSVGWVDRNAMNVKRVEGRLEAEW
jgi:hypothetical protein